MSGESHGGAEAVLDVMGDPECRRLLRSLHEAGPMSVRELHERTGVAQSTLYRKMSRMGETALVAAETHLEKGGRQPTRYRPAAVRCEIAFEDGIEVSVERAATDDGDGGSDDRHPPSSDDRHPSSDDRRVHSGASR